MKQIIRLSVAIFLLVSVAENVQAQCRGAGRWSGLTPFQGYFPTSNTIQLNWAADGNYTGETYRILMKHWLNDPWQQVVTGLKNGTYTVTSFQGASLASSTTYHFLIERYCNGVYVDNINCPSITTKESTYQPPSINYCFGYWYGYTGNDIGSNYIKIIWSYNSTPGHDDKATYIVNYRMNDRDAGTSAWQSQAVTGRNYFTLGGLSAETSYEFLVQKHCNGSYVGSTQVTLSTRSTDAIGSQTIPGPIITGVSSIGQTSATIGLQNYPFFYPGTRIDGFTAYILKRGASVWTEAGYAIAVSREITQYYITASGLTPGSDYYVLIGQHYTLNPGQSYETHHTVYSSVSIFQTDPWGPCNSLNGNFNVPWANVGVNMTQNTEWRYSGTITCASNIILEAPVRVTFTGTAVQLNPGFITNTRTGSFLADAFSPSNCATVGTRMAQQEDIPLESVPPPPTLDGISPEPVQKTPAVTGSGLAVFPNPASGQLTIIPADRSEQIRQIIITDVSGRIVLQRNGNNQTTDISSLKAGTYFYKVETTKNKYTGKFIRL